MSSAESDSPADALEVFAGWLSRRKHGDGTSFDELLRAHPHLAAELARLASARAGLEEAGHPDESDPSLSDRIRERFGEESLPDVSLSEGEPDSPGAQTKSSELIAQLSDRGAGFGRYRIRGEVARGGMGAILKIWDEDLRRHLAMKVILGQVDVRREATPPVDCANVARFLEEAQVTGQLDHPGIVPVHELGLDPEGRLYFTMKLVKGRSLKEVFDLVAEGEGGWTQTKALGVLLKVCEAMSYAHDKGVVHRDLKPANVMVGSFGEVHVMDWGLARIAGKRDRKDIRVRQDPAHVEDAGARRTSGDEDALDSPLYTMDGDVLGTPAYMPPEQAAGKVGEIGPHSDVYALGAMIYHLLAGHAPHLPRGARVDHYALLLKVQQGPPPPIGEISPETSPELAAICDKAMARDWKERYRDISELAADLSAYLEQRVVRAYESGTWAETKKWIARNRALAASVAVAILILVVGVIATTSFAVDAKRESVRADAKTIEAERNADESQSNAASAEKNAAAARENETRAREQERIATEKASDVLSLSAIQELKELVESADSLWPATPALVPKYDAWLAKAGVLVDGRVADAGRGIEAHLGLKDHEAKLAEIRERAKPLSPEQADADRAASPRFADWERARANLKWHARMLGEEPWPKESEVEARLATETLPSDTTALNEIIGPLVDPNPDQVVYGREVEALILARRSVAAAPSELRAVTRSLLAWSLFRTGRFDDAVAEEQSAAAEIDEHTKSGFENFAHQLEDVIATWRTDEARARQADAARQLAARVQELDGPAHERHTYEFEDASDRWWHTQLSQLIADLKSFRDPTTGLYSSGVSESHGWGIPKRAEFARSIEQQSLNGADAERRWNETVDAVKKSASYGGFVLKPVLGLLPLGMDPDSHLFEFAHLQTGTPAVRGANGKLLFTPETGLVLVLIPSGRFWMGAQKTDPQGHNFDPLANHAESPVREVSLDAYFMSKFEMTQGQWLRTVGRNPSQYRPGTRLGDPICDLSCPIEQVTWDECTETLRRLGLVLPTEAQWEYSARGGTTSAWWTGDDKSTIAGAANLADDYCKSHSGPSGWAYETWLDDGWSIHAHVGSYRANAFGLHDVIGNVWEWCRDGYLDYSVPVSAGDGERPTASIAIRVCRGGGWSDGSGTVRSAARLSNMPDSRFSFLGVRPARAITR